MMAPYPMGINSPMRQRIVATPVPDWQLDRILHSTMNDGAAGFPTLTDDVSGNNATITAPGGSGGVYPGGQVYPTFNGTTDYANYGNVASVSDRMALSLWIDAPATWPSDKCLLSKSNINGTGGGEWFVRILGTRIIIYVFGSSGTVQLDLSAHLVNGQTNYYAAILYDSAVGIRLWDNVAGSLAQYNKAGVGGAITPTIQGVMLNSSYWTNLPSALRCCGSSWKKFTVRAVDSSRWASWWDGTHPASEYAAGSGH